MLGFTSQPFSSTRLFVTHELFFFLYFSSQNLSNLQNDEMMLSDESYRQVDASLGGSGSGYYGSSLDSREVLIDDEDYSYGHSGSGSGDSAIEEEEGEDTESKFRSGLKELRGLSWLEKALDEDQWRPQL